VTFVKCLETEQRNEQGCRYKVLAINRPGMYLSIFIFCRLNTPTCLRHCFYGTLKKEGIMTPSNLSLSLVLWAGDLIKEML
jgi:hypothetical protein